MDLSYQQPQPYTIYETSQWPEDFKPAYTERESDSNREEKTPVSATPTDFTVDHHHTRPSMLKVEDEGMWHDRLHEHHISYPARHYSQPIISTHGHTQQYVRVDPNFAASYASAQPSWAMSQSGTATPTPAYGSLDSYGQPVQYATHSGFNFNQDPISAVSMSPQSSQGGWASATSSDGIDQRCMVQSPVSRSFSPHLAQRPDGVRKKNARFEIPKDRNLHTIDAMIMNAANEEEKKELKQQKRLLRNRQAALDSRQRKKTHTEKLEQEKKYSEKKMVDLEVKVEQLEETLLIEREQFMHQRQQYEMQLKQLVHERDETLKHKTMEAADARRQLNAMKEYIRDLPHRPNGYGPTSDMHNVASDFSVINFGEDWDHELNLLGHDLDDHDDDAMNRQTTPRPYTPAVDKKLDADFSWNTFYMCLAFGAVVVAAGGQLAALAKNATDMALPSVSEEYRADARNVLNAVKSTSPQSAQEIVPTRSATGPSASGIADASAGYMRPTSPHSSGLDRMSSTLTTPSRHQEMQQIFAMTPASYNHIMTPLSELDDDADADLPDSPVPRSSGSRLEQAYAAFNARKSHTEKHSYISRAQERSALNVPDSVMNDFKSFVQESRQLQDVHQDPA